MQIEEIVRRKNDTERVGQFGEEQRTEELVEDAPVRLHSAKLHPCRHYETRQHEFQRLVP